MSRPRYKIFIGYDSSDKGRVRYYFQDTDPGCETGMKAGVNYGMVLLYKGRNFVFKYNPHDAIEYCIALNAEDAAKRK
jgi:hypothetical protein